MWWYARANNTWMGVGLIALGAALLARTYLGYELHNWWALFLLIPALAALGTAYDAWRAGRGSEATTQATIGLVIASVAAIFLLNIAWRLAWPVLFIVAGIGLLLPRLAAGRVP